MPEYIKRVGEERTRELQKAIAERLRKQQTEEMPEINTHTQGIAEALRRGLAGIELGREESKAKQADALSRENNEKQSQMLLRALGIDSGGFNSNENNMQNQNSQMGMRSSANSMDMSGLEPGAQNILIERKLKDMDQSRKEKFRHEEGELNRKHQIGMIGEKAKSAVETHQEKKKFEAEQSKLEKWQEEGDAAQNSIREIDSIFSSMEGAKPGVGFNTRQYLANAAQSLGMDVSKLNLGNPGDMLQLTKGLEQLVINMAKEFGSRVLKVEVDGVRAALPTATSSPQALTQVLSRIKNIKQYAASRPSKARAWYDRYGSLYAKNDQGQDFSKAYDNFAARKWFSPQPMEGEE